MPPKRSLDEYRQKRDRTRTPEPFGETRRRGAGDAAHCFVVQQHAARRMHWDFRLEIDGVLVSWAVPRGPSVNPKEKRLAVQTEDHPLEYADFEGIIPPGNYGAGAVIVWDRGTYRSADGVPPAEGLANGKLDVELNGHKLRGRWVVVRTKRGGGKDWLLFRKAEGLAPGPEPVLAHPSSILSGLTVEELERREERTDELAARAKEAGAPRRPLKAGGLSPMLAETAEKPFSRAGWIFELKYDGIRALVAKEPPVSGLPSPASPAPGTVRVFSRTRRDITETFPEIAASAAHLPCTDFILDGEIVAVDGRGAGSFERLQQRLGLTNPAHVARAALEIPVLIYCFDLLAVAGHDLRGLPLITRKQLLRRLLPPQGIVRFADHIERDGAELFAEAAARHAEGVMAKRAASPYEDGRRSRNWLKFKAPHTADLAVVGYLPGKGARARLGALMLGWRAGGELVYAGNVGTGFDTPTLEALVRRLHASERTTAAFRHAPRAVGRNARFVEPQLVAEVRYTEVTSAGLLRQPVFLRLRDDKTIAECDEVPGGRWETGDGRRDQTENGTRRKTGQNRRASGVGLPSPVSRRVPAPDTRLRLTNLDKVFWPAEGYTKGDLLKYYEQVWPYLAPYLRDRPVVLTRYPDGIEGKSFFQKNAPEFIPDWVPTCRIEDTEYFVCNDLETLLYVINLGCIPLHVWSARRDALDHPDWAILDLDPKGAPFSHAVAIARHIHRLLTALGAPHFVKTSGQEGLHILLPLGASMTHDEAKTLAEVLARLVAAQMPSLATIARLPSARGGKVYVDFLQNGFGKTIAAPFSVRPRPGASVSMPLGWGEVNAGLDPARFSIATAPARVRRRGDPMRGVLEAAIDVHAVLAALSEQLGSIL